MGSRTKSRRTVAAAATWTVAVCGARPVKNTWSVTSPAGRPGSRYSPKASVNASRLLPATVMRAFSSAAPPMLFCTRPVSVPGAGVWAETAPARNRVVSSRAASRIKGNVG